MIGIFFNGLDVLYRHAQFWEDRTTRAGCRCENIVTMFLLERLPRRGKTAGIKCTQVKNQHFAGATRWTDSREIWQSGGAHGSA